MTKKKLIKKLILTVGLIGLSLQGKLQRFIDILTGHTTYPLIVPGLNPSTTVVAGKIAIINGYITQRNALDEQSKQLTGLIDAGIDELTDIYTSKWCQQTQAAVAGDENKAIVIGYGVKGGPELSPIPQESSPDITNVVVINGKHTLYIIDNITNKKKKPKGISRIDIYGQTGGTQPANLTELMANGGGWIGEATRGKLENIHTPGNEGKIEYYIAVYIAKKTKKPFSQSAVKSARII